MFGCGNYKIEFIIHYFEDTLDDKEKIEFEDHLMKCDECLKEVLELNRINGAMENSVHIKLPWNDWVIVNCVNGVIDSFVSSFSDLEIVDFAQVRNDNKNIKVLDVRNGKHNEFIRIYQDNGSYTIFLNSDIFLNETVSLRNFLDEVPVFSSKVSSNETVIKGIRNGNYILSYGDRRFFISLNDKKQE